MCYAMPKMLFPTYSPFFNAGFLSHQLLNSTDDLSSPDAEPNQRRGSMPDSDRPLLVSRFSEESSSFYLSLQPKRDSSEFRSFLSLDLAESQSLRSVSIKRRKPTSSSRERYSQFSYRPSAFKRNSTQPSSLDLPLSPLVFATALRRRQRRDSISSLHSLRSIESLPLAKPPPSTPLPTPPNPPLGLPTIAEQVSSCSTSLASAPSSRSASMYSTRSILPEMVEPISDEPPSLPPLRSSALVPFLHSPFRWSTLPSALLPIPPPPPPPPPPPVVSRQDSQRTASTFTRTKHRFNALAMLEGQSSKLSFPRSAFSLSSPTTIPIPTSPTRPRSFMSMFDDDDEDEDNYDDSDCYPAYNRSPCRRRAMSEDFVSMYSENGLRAPEVQVHVPSCFIPGPSDFEPELEELEEDDGVEDAEAEDDYEEGEEEEEEEEELAALAPRICVAPRLLRSPESYQSWSSPLLLPPLTTTPSMTPTTATPSPSPLYCDVSFIDWSDDFKIPELETRKGAQPKPRTWRSLIEISGTN